MGTYAMQGLAVVASRKLVQLNNGGQKMSSTSQIVIGVLVAGIFFLIVLCYMYHAWRRSRERHRAEVYAASHEGQAEARRQARAERRRRRAERARGVPADIIAGFPVREYVPAPSHQQRVSSTFNRSARLKMREAAANALADTDSDPEESPAAVAALSAPTLAPAPVLLATSSSFNARGVLTASQELAAASTGILSKMRTALRPRSARYVAGATPHAGVPGTPTWDVEAPDLDPMHSLQRAHMASCAAAGSAGVAQPSLRTASSMTRLASSVELRCGSGPLLLSTSGGGTAADDAPAPIKQSLSNMPEGDEESLPQCAICLCDYDAGDQLLQLPCGHEFHTSCITSWMGQHRTCPLCRHVLYEQPDSPDHSMQPLGVAAPGPQQQAAPRNRSSRPGAQS